MVLLTGKVTQMLTMPEPHPATYLMRRNHHGAEKKLKALARRVIGNFPWSPTEEVVS